MASIIVVGSINMDLVIRTPRYPESGETVAGHDFNIFHGGKGANQAVAIARQGGNITMIGKVGDDSFGERCLKALQDEGIDVSAIETVSETATGVAVIAVDESGENRIITAPGANGKVSPVDIERHAGRIRSADVLLLQLEAPLESVQRAIEVAAAGDTLVVLNPAPAQELPDEILRHVDVLIPNQTEAALLTGEEARDPLASASALRKRGVDTVVITLGEAGSLVLDEQGQQQVASFRVEVVDTTAAGDAFVGTLTTCLAQGESIRQAVRRANAAGALATTRLGAQPSLPTQDELEQFLQEKEHEK